MCLKELALYNIAMRLGEKSLLLMLASAVAAVFGEPVRAAVYGDASLSVMFDERTGWPVRFMSGKTCVELSSVAWTNLVVLGGEENAAANAARPTMRGMRQIDGQTFVSGMDRGDWRVDAFVRLHPDARMVQRWYRLAYRGKGQGMLRKLFVSSGRVSVGEEGRLMLPLVFPPFDRPARAFHARQTHHAWEQPYAVIADTGRRSAVLFAADTKVPRGDHAPAEIREAPGALEVVREYRTYGRVKAGSVQEVGDDWICFVSGDADAALKTLPVWFGKTGRHAPVDRPEWVQRLMLYCMHPRGPIAADFEGWGGFGPAASQLSRIRDLGLNGVWVLPVEDMWPYTPRDYYAFMPRVGTALEARAFSDRAHALGLKVLHDIVPHGGRSDTPRALTHPEWVVRNEDGTMPDYWCYDFNWPSWQDFIGAVARHNMAEFALDGFRIDAVDGSHYLNWNPAIPYARASFAKSQGGYAMQRVIRAAARAVNPNSAILSEVGPGFYATESDIIYDLLFCHDVLPRLPGFEPSETAAWLRRRFHEDAIASPPGTLKMRYPESHDSMRAEWLYGPAPYRALMALAAWVPGVPMVLQESEDGHADALKEIFGVRAAMPELNGFEADFLSVKAPPGVFAALRGTNVVMLVNFNPDRMEGLVVIPSGEAFPIDLPPFGFAVMRNGKNVLDAPPARQSQASDPVVTSVRSADGLVFHVRDADAWFAHAADGSFASPFRVRHPGFDGKIGPFYRQVQGDNVLWDSRLHALGLEPSCAEVGGVVNGRAAVIGGFGADAEVRLLDRIGTEHGLHVVVRGDTSNVRVRFADSSSVRPARPVSSGDARLKAVLGGWQFEEGGRRIRFRRNGARLGEWERAPDGVWRRVQGADDGMVAHEIIDGTTRTYAQCHDVEAFTRLERLSDGTLEVTFDGECRTSKRIGRMRKPVPYRTVWRLGNGRIECKQVNQANKEERKHQ